jgi:transcriptional regulator with XRE-family HTH domain
MQVRTSGPHLVDIHVGERVKLFRNMEDVTQSELATHLGLTFQQVQKYERGANRISSSKLYEISHILGREIPEFFEGLERDTKTSKTTRNRSVGNEITDMMSSREGLRLNRAFVKITDPGVRSKVIALLESLADDTAKD